MRIEPVRSFTGMDYRNGLLNLTTLDSWEAHWLLVLGALASCARGPGFDPRRRRGKFVGPSLLPFVSFAGMT